MKIEEELSPNNDLEDVPTTFRYHTSLKPKRAYTPPEETVVSLFARIKRYFTYYHQGLDHNGIPQLCKVEAIRRGFPGFRLNDNSYSSHDLAFYVSDVQGHLIPLAGGMEDD